MASSLDQKPCARCGDPNHAILYCNPNKKFTTRSWPTAQDEEKHKCERKFHDAMKKKGVERQRLMLEAIKDLSPPAQPPTTIPIRSGPASAANGSAPIVAQIVAKVSPSPSPAIRLEEDPSRPMNEILDADASSDHLDAIQRFRAKLSSFAAVKKANFESTDIHCMRTAFASADIPEGQKNLEHPNPKRVATRVFTNHFDVTLQPGTVLYEYTIVPINSTLSRAKKRLLVKSFIENCPTLKNNIGKFATDYVSTVIAWESLHNLQEYDLESDVDHAEVTSYTSGEKDSGVPLQLFLRFTNCWPTNTLQNYVDGQPDATTMMSVKEESPLIKAFNTIILETLQDPANSSWKALQTNEKKYFTERGWGKLGDNGTLHAHRGYSLTVRPAMGRILLNLNTATSAFFPAWPLRRFIHHLQVAYGNKEQAYAALKGLRVYINFERGQSSDGTPLGAQALNQPTRRIKSITGVGLPPAQQDFIIDEETEETVFVKDYFEGKYKRKLLHLELPCINVGSEARETWFAPELLEILPYQIFRHKIPGALAGDMISKAARTPALNKRLIIGERLRTLGIHANRPAKSFGSTSKLQSFIPHANRICATQAAGKISISPDMITIPAIKLPAPTVLYRGKPKKANAKAQWTLAAVKLDHIPKITIKIHVVFWELHATTDRFIIDQFVNEMKECGFDRPVRNEQWYDVAKSGSDVKKALQQAVNNHCNLVIMVFGQKDVDIYSRFKHVAEQQFGLNTLCLCQDKAEECRKKAAEKRPDRLLMEYMSNVGLKVNLKIGGINHQVQGLGTYLPDTMIIGADVTHPGAGAVGGVPSIAAVVASTDATAGRYLGSMRLQPKANDESIKDLKEMVEERLEAWCNQDKKGRRPLPASIIFYRDGVGDSQFRVLREQEIYRIKQAYNAYRTRHNNPADPKSPKVTAIVVAKRHNVRFFPKDPRDPLEATNNGNCHPGLLVDSGVTSPYYMDFYLQAHNGLKGTAKPAHYIVLQDENNFSVDQIHDLTFKLSYTYVRATLGVSYAPPAYYADRLCERGRCYLRNYLVPDAAMKRKTENAVTQEVYQVWANNGGNLVGPWRAELNNTMFWM